MKEDIGNIPKCDVCGADTYVRDFEYGPECSKCHKEFNTKFYVDWWTEYINHRKFIIDTKEGQFLVDEKDVTPCEWRGETIDRFCFSKCPGRIKGECIFCSDDGEFNKFIEGRELEPWKGKNG